MKLFRLVALALALCAAPALSASPQPQASAAAESCHSWASARLLYGASGYIGAAGYIMVFDSPSAPADGSVLPAAWAYVSAAGSWSIWYGPNPASFVQGVTVCASSTGPLTKTAYSTNTVFSAQVGQ